MIKYNFKKNALKTFKFYYPRFAKKNSTWQVVANQGNIIALSQ